MLDRINCDICTLTGSGANYLRITRLTDLIPDSIPASCAITDNSLSSVLTSGSSSSCRGWISHSSSGIGKSIGELLIISIGIGAIVLPTRPLGRRLRWPRVVNKHRSIDAVWRVYPIRSVGPAISVRTPCRICVVIIRASVISSAIKSSALIAPGVILVAIS